MPRIKTLRANQTTQQLYSPPNFSFLIYVAVHFGPTKQAGKKRINISILPSPHVNAEQVLDKASLLRDSTFRIA